MTSCNKRTHSPAHPCARARGARATGCGEHEEMKTPRRKKEGKKKKKKKNKKKKKRKEKKKKEKKR